VANVVEKDLRRVAAGAPAKVEVDAFPGEAFSGRIARIAPVLDPATRTAEIEVEIPNRDFRLKPGMYARVSLTIAERANALVVPRNAVVDIEGQRGVFLARRDTAEFRPVKIGLEEPQRVEIVAGLDERDRVITTGAAALRDGDRIVLAGQRGGGAGGRPDVNRQGGATRRSGPGD
jgi:RND family efflux transporter MFP subunit